MFENCKDLINTIISTLKQKLVSNNSVFVGIASQNNYNVIDFGCETINCIKRKYKDSDEADKTKIGFVFFNETFYIMFCTAVFRAIKRKYTDSYLIVFVNNDICYDILKSNSDVDELVLCTDDYIQNLKKDSFHVFYNFNDIKQFIVNNRQNKNIFQILSEYFDFNVDASDQNILCKSNKILDFLLNKKKYVTIQVSLDEEVKGNVKSILYSKFEKLVNYIHVKYGIEVFQISFSNDIKLFGTVDLMDLDIFYTAHVIKNALCHIGPVSIFTHIARSLNVPSIVLFGPVPVSFCGYENNINLCSNTHICKCCWFEDERWEKCKDSSVKICLNEISLNQLQAAVDKFLSKKVFLPYEYKKSDFVSDVNGEEIVVVADGSDE